MKQIMASSDKGLLLTQGSILDSSSRSLKRGCFVALFLLIMGMSLSSFPYILYAEDTASPPIDEVTIFEATPWELDSALSITKTSITTLQQRFPLIQNPLDLSRILVSTSFKSPSSNLRIERVGDKWYIRGKSAATVVGIDFSLAPLALLPNLRNATSNWIGQVHTEDLKTKVEKDITQFLRQSGYRSAKTVITTDQSDDKIRYKASLNIGEPCIVLGYIWPDTLPQVQLPVLEKGQICDENLAAASIDEIEDKLHESGWVQSSLDFSGFLTDTNEANAYIKVSGTIGEKIVYSFVDPITGGDAAYMLTSSELQLMTPNVTGPDAAAYELAHQLKNRGYLDVNVAGPEIVRDTPGVAKYVFSVNRGEIFRISSVQFEGNQFFSSGELSSTIKIDTSLSSGDEPSLPPYNPDSVTSGTEFIKNQYIEAGFWDVEVSERVSQVSASDRRRVQIIVTVDEGQRRLFERLNIVGATQISTDELEELWDAKAASPFERSQILSFQQKVRSAYASRGYFYTTVSVELISRNLSTQDVGITAKAVIDEGPRVKFGDIFVAGLVKTQQKVVTREVLFETGDWYDPAFVLASRRALLRLGIFSSVVITPVDPVALSNRAEMMDILIEVKESPSRTISFGPGWSSFYGMRYNVEGALTNLGGTGRRINSRATFDQEKSQNAIGPRTLVGRLLSAGYLEPHILDSPIDGTISLSQSAASTEYAWALTRGGEVEFSHALRAVVPGSRIGLFYGRKLSEEEGEDTAKDAFLADTYGSGRVGVRFHIDHRDDPAWPTEGYTLTSELAWARYELGGDLRYFRWEIGNNHYFSIWDELVLALGINFSAYQDVTRKNETSGDILPATERLSMGGEESVRGFPRRSLGPIVRRPDFNANGEWENCGFTETATGGSRRTLIKAELRYRWTASFATTAFLDSGNTSFSDEEMEKFDRAFTGIVNPSKPSSCAGKPARTIEDNIGYELGDLPTNPGYLWDRHFTSFGTALNFLTPIGSINLGYGVPWHEPKSTECRADGSACFPRAPVTTQWWKKGEIHLNVGAKF